MTQATKAMTAEERALRREAREAARVAAEQERKEREEAAKAERRKVMPAVLFKLLTDVQKLSNAGMDVYADVVVQVPTSSYGRTSAYEEKEGVRVVFGRCKGEDEHGYSLMRDTYLTLESEAWEVDVVYGDLRSLQEELEFKKKQQAMAEEAKKLLSPEQLEALRKYG